LITLNVLNNVMFCSLTILNSTACGLRLVDYTMMQTLETLPSMNSGYDYTPSLPCDLD